ncbi:hypothetical protein SRABI98_03387 [Microbacterium sp. Bi98]|uniref:DUF4231 domain-containing protein n=1 Tax=unclassified Microbacterium TaxID=2609290 RepID=UPI000700B061|nr:MULTISPECIES: DUF4231 domain-containing protein [unclassified Microbacterium]KRD53950.1 hypothetical protein ASE34_02350 [Microbacterium sp. Root280D1]CAH0256372.1 hypothetical protein SRABI98_03387 [Microbacterium sp. Bi98]
MSTKDRSALFAGFSANRRGWLASIAVIAIALLGPPLIIRVPDNSVGAAAIAVLACVIAASLIGFFASVDSAARIVNAIAFLIAAGAATVFVQSTEMVKRTQTQPFIQSNGAVITATLLAVGMLLAVAAGIRGSKSSPKDNSDGLRPPSRPDPMLKSLDAMFYYLEWWEGEFNRTRKVVKRRAAKVIIWTTVLTGMIAVFGAISASASNNLLQDLIAICTTAASATIAVLLAWNEHFHHKDLWIQRSQVLHELQTIRIEYERASREAKSRRARRRLATNLSTQLKRVLAQDVRDWKGIQGGR